MASDTYIPIPVTNPAGKTGRKTPIGEFVLFRWGENPTSKGSILLDQEGAEEVFRRYREYTGNRGGYLDIDIAHLSQTDIPAPVAHESSGKFRIAPHPEGIAVNGIQYRPEIYEAVAEEKYKYYSPVVELEASTRRLLEISQLALTNIPAMDRTVPLALTKKSKETTMSFSRLACIALLSATYLETHAEEGTGMRPLLTALEEAMRAKYAGCFLEDVYETYAIVRAPRTGDGSLEEYRKIPYSLVNGKVELGDAIPVRHSWTLTDVGKEEEARMSRAAETERQLLSSTGKTTVAGALTELERLQQVEKSSRGLAERLSRLETSEYSSKREVLLSQAKSAGTWTKSLEILADKAAGMAKRLGEDPASAFREVFSAAPVVVHPGQEHSREVQVADPANGMTPEETEICQNMAKGTGTDPVKFIETYKQVRAARK